MPRPLPRMELTDKERKELLRTISSPTSEQRRVLRARIVLMAEEGCSTKEICLALDVTKPVVVKWRSRFVRHRLEGLRDAERAGRPRKHDAARRLQIATEACRPPDNRSHWSLRELAAHLGVPQTLVFRVLKAESIKPHLQEMWLNSRDPDFEAKQAEIVGLYMNPPENAFVLCLDEKTGMQALGRKHPDKPVAPGRIAKREFEYVRHGTKSLIAAFCVHDGTVTGKAYDRHTNEEFLDFLMEIARRFPTGELHLIVDNLSVHNHPNVRVWLARDENKRIQLHFTPTHASWLNQIEIWFSILGRKILKRGVFNSKEELVARLMAFIDEYNRTAKPFRWTHTGDPLVA